MMAIRLMVSHYVAIYQHKLNKYLHIDCVKFIKTQNRSLELRFLFLFPKHFFTQAKKLFPQPLALLSSCGGIGGERLIEGGAQAAGLAEVAAAASVDIGDAGALRPVLHQIGADKTVGAARGVERGARLAKDEAHLDLAAIPAAGDGSRGEDLRAKQVIPGVGQEGVALDKWGLLVGASRVAISRAFEAALSRQSSSGETIVGSAPPRSL